MYKQIFILIKEISKNKISVYFFFYSVRIKVVQIKYTYIYIVKKISNKFYVILNQEIYTKIY